MNSNPKITATVRQLLSEYLTKARSLYKEEEITDFVVRFDLENGTLSVSDDNEVILSTVSLPSDIELDDEVVGLFGPLLFHLCDVLLRLQDIKSDVVDFDEIRLM